MSESGARTLIETMEAWALTIGQPLLLLLIFALYYVQAWTSQSPAQISAGRRSGAGISPSVPDESGGADMWRLPVAWVHAVSSVHNATPIRILPGPSEITKALTNPA